jgi:hypothetical protein
MVPDRAKTAVVLRDSTLMRGTAFAVFICWGGESSGAFDTNSIPVKSEAKRQPSCRNEDMRFEKEDSDIPDGLATDDFVLRPIKADDAEMDYAAVMESRDYLRTWEQTGWPADDFTATANREDLEKLERRHASREAFTYTIVNPAGTECLGCVYIVPTDARWLVNARITPAGNRRWDDYDAAVYFWMRASQLAAETDRVLLDALRTWLSQDWKFREYLILTSELFTQQVDMIESTDLELRFEVRESEKPGRYLAYD